MHYTRLYNTIRNVLSPQPEEDEPYDDEEDVSVPEREDINEDGLPRDRAAARVRRGSAASYNIKTSPHWRTGVRNRGTRGGMPKEHQNPVLSKSAQNITPTDTRYGQRLRNLLRNLLRRRRGFTGRGGRAYAANSERSGTIHRVSKTKMRKGSMGSKSDSANSIQRSRRHQHVRKKLLEAAGTKIDFKRLQKDWYGKKDPNWQNTDDDNSLKRELKKARKTPNKIDLKPTTQ